MAIIRHRQGYVDIYANPPATNQAPIYEHEQTVENDPREGLPEHGNRTRINMRTLYDAWNASYRGLTPHQINPVAITNGAATAPAPTHFEDGKADNPQTFDEGTPQTIADGDESESDKEQNAATPVTVVDVANDFFHVYRVNVGATTPQMIVAQQRFRSSVRITNLGNQTVWIAETESRLTDGWPMYAAAAGSSPDTHDVGTSREIWAIADPAAAGNLMSVAVMITYARKELQ